MRKYKNILYSIKIYVGIGFTVVAFLGLALYIVINGLSHLSLDFVLGWGKNGTEGLLPVIVTTVIVIGLTLLIALPIGVGSAIYLNEYAKKGSKIVKIIRLAVETLAGIPSIIYGLFGFLFFVITLGWSWSILAGVCTLSIMILPTIMRSTEEALISVPDGYREGSFALGAGKFRTIGKIVLPTAMPGIMAAVILAIGRIVGESAALILTAGTVVGVPKDLFSSGATLSVFMYTLASEGLHFGEAYATAIVLMVVVFLINLIANHLGNRLKKGKDR